MEEEKRYFIDQILKMLKSTDDIKIIKYFYYLIKLKLEK